MLVLDANILIRAVLGPRVLSLIRTYRKRTEFRAPELAFDEAMGKLPRLIEKRGLNPVVAREVFEYLQRVVNTVPIEIYRPYGTRARKRLEWRDPKDWSYLACALAFDVAIWTEDRDFFGVGVATWTTDRVELFLRGD